MTVRSNHGSVSRPGTDAKTASVGRRRPPVLGSQRIRDWITGYLFILPAFISLAVWWLYPLAYSLYLGFTEWDFMSPQKKWVGLENYAKILTHREFRRVLWNTAYFSVGTVALGLLGGLIAAPQPQAPRPAHLSRHDVLALDHAHRGRRPRLAVDL